MKSTTLFNKIQRKLTFLLFILFLTPAGVSFAQHGTGQGGGGNPPEVRAKRQTDYMKEPLKLTAAQEPKVYAIALKYAKKMDEALALTDDIQRSKAIQGNDKAKDAELKVILTADQFKAYLKLKEEVKARRRK